MSCNFDASSKNQMIPSKSTNDLVNLKDLKKWCEFQTFVDNFYRALRKGQLAANLDRAQVFQRCKDKLDELKIECAHTHKRAEEYIHICDRLYKTFTNTTA